MGKIIKVDGHELYVMRTALIAKGSRNYSHAYRLQLADGSIRYGVFTDTPEHACQLNLWSSDYDDFREMWNDHIKDSYSESEHEGDGLLPEDLWEALS